MRARRVSGEYAESECFLAWSATASLFFAPMASISRRDSPHPVADERKPVVPGVITSSKTEWVEASVGVHAIAASKYFNSDLAAVKGLF